jgi:predicted ester cyclase
MAKEIPAFLRAEIGNDATNPTQEARNGMFGRLAQMRPAFPESQFECQRILRKIDQLRVRSFDRLPDANDLV